VVFETAEQARSEIDGPSAFQSGVNQRWRHSLPLRVRFSDGGFFALGLGLPFAEVGSDHTLVLPGFETTVRKCRIRFRPRYNRGRLPLKNVSTARIADDEILEIQDTGHGSGSLAFQRLSPWDHSLIRRQFDENLTAGRSARSARRGSRRKLACW
jgi:hypothetical protein